MRKLKKTFLLLGVLLLAGCAAPEATEYPKEMDMTTWSIVAVDPETGDVGVAVSSCVPSFGDAVAALVPGKGAAATQAGFNIDNRNRVFEAIQEGLTAEAVIARVTDPQWDDELERRQYGVVTMADGFVRTAGYTTPLRQGLIVGDEGVARYAGVMADPSRGVSAQGNTLASSEVVPGAAGCLSLGRSGGFQHIARSAHTGSRGRIHRRRRCSLQSGERAADHIDGGHPGRARWGRALRCREHRYDGRGYRQGALARALRAHGAWGGKPPVGTPPAVRRVATDSGQVGSGEPFHVTWLSDIEGVADLKRVLRPPFDVGRDDA